MSVGGTESLRLDTEMTWEKVLNPTNTTNSSNTTKESHCNEMHFGKIQWIHNQPWLLRKRGGLFMVIWAAWLKSFAIMGKMHFDPWTKFLSSEEALVNCILKYFSSKITWVIHDSSKTQKNE